MPDWDEDSPELRENLRAVLRGIRDAARQRQPLTLATIRRWHRETLRELSTPHPVWVGRFRGESNLDEIEGQIGAHRGVPAGKMAGEVEHFETRLERVVDRLDRAIAPDADLNADQLEAVLNTCAWAHSEWVRIHPFANGNGRVARLLANALAMRYGLPPFVRLRPRPNHGYDRAADACMRSDHRPLATAFRHMLDAALS